MPPNTRGTPVDINATSATNNGISHNSSGESTVIGNGQGDGLASAISQPGPGTGDEEELVS